MESYKARKMPYEEEIDNECKKILYNIYESYGEYKGYLKNLSFDYKYFLEHNLISEFYYSFAIDGLKITKDDMFYMPYKNINNTVNEFNNIKKAFYVGLTSINKSGYVVENINKINKILFLNCKKDNQTKGSGKLRKIQTYILKPGLVGSSVSFVPPNYKELNSIMKNWCEYLNDTKEDPFIKMILSHFQFEKVHPYVSGNGRIGRILLPIVLSNEKKETPILFISEELFRLKNTYFTLLSEEDNYNNFVKYMLECINNQCQNNIKKLKKLNDIYNEDYKKICEDIGGTTILKVYPLIFKKIVFSTNDIVKEGKIHINSVNKVLNKLVEKGYIIKDKKSGMKRVTFCYKRLNDFYINQ